MLIFSHLLKSLAGSAALTCAVAGCQRDDPQVLNSTPGPEAPVTSAPAESAAPPSHKTQSVEVIELEQEPAPPLDLRLPEDLFDIHSQNTFDQESENLLPGFFAEKEKSQSMVSGELYFEEGGEEAILKKVKGAEIRVDVPIK